MVTALLNRKTISTVEMPMIAISGRFISFTYGLAILFRRYESGLILEATMAKKGLGGVASGAKKVRSTDTGH
jgi:hypothetical protein